MDITIKDIAGALGDLGMPSMFLMVSWCVKSCYGFIKRMGVVENAQKAQMRGQLLDRYYLIKERGFVWQDELTEWVNQYKAYHELRGDNQVLDARCEELLNFPSKQR